MKNLLLVVVVSQLISCSVLSIEHEKGDLPKIRVEGADKYCTDKFKTKIKRDQILIECRILF